MMILKRTFVESPELPIYHIDTDEVDAAGNALIHSCITSEYDKNPHIDDEPFGVNFDYAKNLCERIPMDRIGELPLVWQNEIRRVLLHNVEKQNETLKEGLRSLLGFSWEQFAGATYDDCAHSIEKDCILCQTRALIAA